MGKGGAGSSSNTMWPGLRPTCVPSFTLIHPTVWPQYTNITDRETDRADNGPIAQGEPFYKRSPKNCTTLDCASTSGQSTSSTIEINRDSQISHLENTTSRRDPERWAWPRDRVTALDQ